MAALVISGPVQHLICRHGDQQRNAGREFFPRSFSSLWTGHVQVTQLFSQYVLRELEDYAKAPAKAWKSKDCAIYLVVALTVQVCARCQHRTGVVQLKQALEWLPGLAIDRLPRMLLCCSVLWAQLKQPGLVDLSGPPPPPLTFMLLMPVQFLQTRWVCACLQGKTSAQGATTTNQLVNLLDFFNQHVAPELQNAAASSSASAGKAVLVADALKFLTTFRSQIPKSTLVALFASLVDALGSPSNVVHSYAAICIERLLVSKARPPALPVQDCVV